MIQKALATQLGFIHFTVHKNIEGLAHGESLQPPAGGGNCINWVLGHMVNSRRRMLELVGSEAVLESLDGAAYARGSEPLGPGSPCVPLEELVRLYDASQEALLARISAAGQTEMERPVPKLFEPDQQEPTGVNLATLVFHEAYHAGQLGVIRHAIGLAPAIQ